MVLKKHQLGVFAVLQNAEKLSRFKSERGMFVFPPSKTLIDQGLGIKNDQRHGSRPVSVWSLRDLSIYRNIKGDTARPIGLHHKLCLLITNHMK